MNIVSVLAIVELVESLDLDLLLEKLEGAKTYKNMKIVFIRIHPENYYVSFFAVGKILIYGLKSFDEIDTVAARVLNKLKTAGMDNSIKDVKIGNIVLKDRIKLNKSLETLIRLLDNNKASYEPEIFPALIYKDDFNYTLFSNGKVIITGVKDLDILQKNYNEFVELLQNE